jgi:hypothetical protein
VLDKNSPDGISLLGFPHCYRFREAPP